MSKGHLAHRAATISEHDTLISQKLGHVLCGGDLSEPTEVSEQYLLDLERKTFLELDAAQNAGALAVDHHQREGVAELMNAVKHSGCWGVPARRLAVALSATSPRFAAGFPLLSLTRSTHKRATQ